MAIVVIGGQSRSLGKTSVVAGLIAVLPSYNWTAFKVTQYGHGQCSLNGEPCHCATADHTWAITEEADRSGTSDSARFLSAGAKRSFWVRTEQSRLAEAMPMLRRRLAEADNAILESNSILKFIRPDLYITVLDPGTEDFKASAQEFLDRVDAVILHQGDKGGFRWHGTSLKPVADRPIFLIRPPNYVTDEIIAFVETHLKTKAKRPTALS